jgi:hypothetical protein
MRPDLSLPLPRPGVILGCHLSGHTTAISLASVFGRVTSRKLHPGLEDKLSRPDSVRWARKLEADSVPDKMKMKLAGAERWPSG